jgi:uncharacterized low-complexity protein
MMPVACFLIGEWNSSLRKPHVLTVSDSNALVKAGMVKAGMGKAGMGKAGMGKAGMGKAGMGKAGMGKAVSWIGRP